LQPKTRLSALQANLASENLKNTCAVSYVAPHREQAQLEGPCLVAIWLQVGSLSMANCQKKILTFSGTFVSHISLKCATVVP
jgi:hypothetical protein